MKTIVLLDREYILAAFIGAFLFGYCIYFDRRRKDTPGFYKKLRKHIFLKSQLIFNLKKKQMNSESGDSADQSDAFVLRLQCRINYIHSQHRMFYILLS